MLLSRALVLAATLFVVSAGPVSAQFGGMPGMPGMPAGPGAGPGFGRPAAPPPACQNLLNTKAEVEKHAAAVSAADKRKAPPAEACKLFKVFLGAEVKMLKSLEDSQTICGIPPEVIKQVKASHARAGEVAKVVCDAAALGPRPAGPTLSDALGTTPAVPDAPNANKQRGGMFDTLTGNVLAR